MHEGPASSESAVVEDKWLGEVLLDCARLTCDPAAAFAKTPVRAGPDAWRRCLETLRDNGLSPAGYLRLGGLPATPDHVRRQLRRSYEISSVNHEFLRRELLTILEKLDSAGIRAIPFKGVLIAETMYPEPALRSSNDLDILIGERDIGHAKQILEGDGYEALTAENPDCVRKCMYHFHFVRLSPPTHVELHWRIVPPYFHFPLDFDDLWSRAKPAKSGSASIPSLCVEDLILVLCANGAKENWRSMKVLCDITRICASCTDIDWRCISDRARKLRQTRIIGLGVALAHRLMDCKIPPDVRAGIDRDPAIPALVDKYAGRFLRGQARKVSGRRNHFDLMGIWCGGRGQAAYVRHVIVRRIPDRFRVLLAPTEADRALGGRGRLEGVPSSFVRVSRLILKYWNRPIAGVQRFLDVLLG